MKHEVKREAFSVTMWIRSHFWQNAVVQKPLDPKGLSIGCSESRSTMRREAFLRYRKNKSYSDQTVYYDSDAIYRNQSIYGGTNLYQQQGTYVPPSLDSAPVASGSYCHFPILLTRRTYQPPSYPVQEEQPSVGYRPPLFPGSSELAEVAPEPVEEEPKKVSVRMVVAC